MYLEALVDICGYMDVRYVRSVRCNGPKGQVFYMYMHGILIFHQLHETVCYLFEIMRTSVHEQRLVLSGHIGFGCQSRLVGIWGMTKWYQSRWSKGVYKAVSKKSLTYQCVVHHIYK